MTYTNTFITTLVSRLMNSSKETLQLADTKVLDSANNLIASLPVLLSKAQKSSTPIKNSVKSTVLKVASTALNTLKTIKSSIEDALESAENKISQSLTGPLQSVDKMENCAIRQRIQVPEELKSSKMGNELMACVIKPVLSIKNIAQTTLKDTEPLTNVFTSVNSKLEDCINQSSGLFGLFGISGEMCISTLNSDMTGRIAKVARKASRSVSNVDEATDNVQRCTKSVETAIITKFRKIGVNINHC